MIAIINDSDISNIASIYNAVYIMGHDAEVIKYEELSDKYSHLIVPGVGSYKNALKNNNLSQAKEKVKQFLSTGRPMLGICLGMQLLSDWGEEHGGSEGLGLIPGKVIKLPQSDNLLLPHVGWNNVNFTKDHPVFDSVKTGIDCYFVHSYHFACSNNDHIYGHTNYGRNFTSIVARDNIIGLQFHPEKSQGNGLKLINNFCNWDGLC